MEKVAEFIDLGMQIAFEIKDEMIKTEAVGKSGQVTAKVSFDISTSQIIGKLQELLDICGAMGAS